MSRQSLADDRTRFVYFAFAEADLLVELDLESRIQWTSGAVQMLLGHEPTQIVGRPLQDFVNDADARVLAAGLRHLRAGERLRNLKLALRPASLQNMVLEVHAYRPEQAGAGRYFLSARLRPKDAQHHAIERAMDRATGLMQAAAFKQSALDAIARAKESGQTTKMTLLQICDRPQLEKSIGHDRTDALLAEIGAEIKFHALDHDLAGMIGDGRFGVTHASDVDGSQIVELINRIGDAFSIDRGMLAATSKTVDFTESPTGETDIESILSYILTRFNESGASALENGTANVYLRKLMTDTLTRVTSMRDILHQERIRLHFQPIVRLSDLRPVHHEVLLRFEDGRSPFEDVLFAEKVNIIHEVDLAVANMAVRRLLAEDAHAKGLVLAINMSARSLLNNSFMTMFDRICQQLGSSRSKLMIELTETANLGDLDIAARAIESLRVRGHEMCLDDFGAGSSSLPYLRHLTVDCVKIDGAYVRSVASDIRERAIVAAVLAACRGLKVRTVAEMVEREEQKTTLKELGVELGQGWLFGRPSQEIQRISSVPSSTPVRLGRRKGPVEVWS